MFTTNMLYQSIFLIVILKFDKDGSRTESSLLSRAKNPINLYRAKPPLASEDGVYLENNPLPRYQVPAPEFYGKVPRLFELSNDVNRLENIRYEVDDTRAKNAYRYETDNTYFTPANIYRYEPVAKPVSRSPEYQVPYDHIKFPFQLYGSRNEQHSFSPLGNDYSYAPVKLSALYMDEPMWRVRPIIGNERNYKHKPIKSKYLDKLQKAIYHTRSSTKLEIYHNQGSEENNIFSEVPDIHSELTGHHYRPELKITSVLIPRTPSKNVGRTKSKKWFSLLITTHSKTPTTKKVYQFVPFLTNEAVERNRYNKPLTTFSKRSSYRFMPTVNASKSLDDYWEEFIKTESRRTKNPTSEYGMNLFPTLLVEEIKNHTQSHGGTKIDGFRHNALSRTPSAIEQVYYNVFLKTSGPVDKYYQDKNWKSYDTSETFIDIKKNVEQHKPLKVSRTTSLVSLLLSLKHSEEIEKEYQNEIWRTYLNGMLKSTSVYRSSDGIYHYTDPKRRWPLPRTSPRIILTRIFRPFETYNDYKDKTTELLKTTSQVNQTKSFETSNYYGPNPSRTTNIPDIDIKNEPFGTTETMEKSNEDLKITQTTEIAHKYAPSRTSEETGIVNKSKPTRTSETTGIVYKQEPFKTTGVMDRIYKNELSRTTEKVNKEEPSNATGTMRKVHKDKPSRTTRITGSVHKGQPSRTNKASVIIYKTEPHRTTGGADTIYKYGLYSKTSKITGRVDEPSITAVITKNAYQDKPLKITDTKNVYKNEHLNISEATIMIRPVEASRAFEETGRNRLQEHFKPIQTTEKDIKFKLPKISKTTESVFSQESVEPYEEIENDYPNEIWRTYFTEFYNPTRLSKPISFPEYNYQVKLSRTSMKSENHPLHTTIPLESFYNKPIKTFKSSKTTENVLGLLKPRRPTEKDTKQATSKSYDEMENLYQNEIWRTYLNEFFKTTSHGSFLPKSLDYNVKLLNAATPTDDFHQHVQPLQTSLIKNVENELLKVILNVSRTTEKYLQKELLIPNRVMDISQNGIAKIFGATEKSSKSNEEIENDYQNRIWRTYFNEFFSPTTESGSSMENLYKVQPLKTTRPDFFYYYVVPLNTTSTEHSKTTNETEKIVYQGFKTLWKPTADTTRFSYNYLTTRTAPSSTARTFNWNFNDKDAAWPKLELILATTGRTTTTSRSKKSFATYFPFLRESDRTPEITTEDHETGETFEDLLETTTSTTVFYKTRQTRSCYECGLDVVRIPYAPTCYHVFEKPGAFPGLNPYLYKVNCEKRFDSKDDPEMNYKGGCFKRFVDIGEVYNERGCRTMEPRKGKSFASKRLANLERLLKDVAEGCITSPYASLTPFSRAVSLYARYHVCVCQGNYCNNTPMFKASCVLIFCNILLRI